LATPIPGEISCISGECWRIPASGGPGFEMGCVDCPIFVEDEVLKISKISSAISEKSTSEEVRKWLEGLSDEDLG
jgi:hypothetical protein